MFKLNFKIIGLAYLFFLISCGKDDNTTYPLRFKNSSSAQYDKTESYLIGKDSSFKLIPTSKGHQEYMDFSTDSFSDERGDDIIIESDSTITFESENYPSVTVNYKLVNGFIVIDDKRFNSTLEYDVANQKIYDYLVSFFAISSKYKKETLGFIAPSWNQDKFKVLNDLLKQSHFFSGTSSVTLPKSYKLSADDTLCVSWGKQVYKLR
jgi:hypothetical protein